MTDNSNVVLRWEIDNAAARFATGKVESEVFDEGGFKWTAAVERRADFLADRIDLSLLCGVDHSRFWKCEAEVDPHLCQANRTHNFISKDRFCFDENSDRWKLKSAVSWEDMTRPHNNINDTVTLEFRIRIISSEKCEPIADLAKFTSPNIRSNVILKIGDEKLHVSKEYLAIHSPVFDAMFFGDFAEKGKEEVELKDVLSEEFIDLLHLIYPRPTKISDRTVPHILKLADRFQMEGVVYLSAEHLIESKGFNAAKKLLIADQYRLDSLRARVLHSFSNVSEVVEVLKSSPEFVNFSEGTKTAILERIVKLQ